MWLRPSADITSNLSEFQIPIHRNTEFCGNCDEFAFAFDPSYASTPSGHLRFKAHDENGLRYEVISDANFWQAGQWYHIAGVIDPIQGMMMFIDGVKQINTEPNYTAPTTTSSAITVIGAQGDRYIRHFFGEIDEVRLSSNARYTANFIPNCEFSVDSTTTSLYKLDLISNNKTPDLVNSQSGLTNSVSISTNVACDSALVTFTEENKKHEIGFDFYPNPVKDMLTINTSLTSTEKFELSIHNLRGKLLNRSALSGNLNQIALEAMPAGFYLLSIRKDGVLYAKEKILKQ